LRLLEVAVLRLRRRALSAARIARQLMERISDAVH